MHLHGRFNRQHFTEAWSQVIQRHASLRAAFIWDGVDEPLQIIRRKVSMSWELLDWRTRPESGYQDAIKSRMQTDRIAAFDLAEAPLMRMTLIQLNDDSWQLLWTFHHLLMDGWSASIVLGDVQKLYHAASTGALAELTDVRPWRDHIAALQARDASADEPFWRSYLAGFHARNCLQSAAVQGNHPDSSMLMTEQALSTDITGRLTDIVRELRVTMSTLIHGVWALLLHHYCDDSDLVFGSTVSGRPADIAGVEHMVGMFINTLPVRVTVDNHGTLREWFQDLQKNLLELRDYEATPLVNAQSWSDLPRGESLFDSIVVFENFPTSDAGIDDGGLAINIEQHLEQSNFPLALLVIPGECVRLIVVHRLSRYDEATALQILHHLQTLLSSIPAYLEQSPTALPILDDIERQQLDDWNDTKSKVSSNSFVHRLISDQARKIPDCNAVVCNNESLTFTELDSLSNQWAHEFIARGVKPGEHVAICINRSVTMIVAVLAALKAGAVYVPLDPAYPIDRLNAQLLDCGAKIVLTDKQSATLPYASGEALIMDVDVPVQRDTDPAINIDDNAIAYVIYTSGSTGKPKGVQVTHRNLLYSTDARLQYYPQQPSAFLLLSSIAFDSSVAGIFWTLCTGGTLVVSGYRMEQDPTQLAQYIAQHEVTHTLCLPSLYRALLDYADNTLLQLLNTVIVAGEAFPATGLLELHRKTLPDAALYNEYGPTETTVWATVFDTRHVVEGSMVNIGKPIANTSILLLDSKGRRCAVGLPGEICIAGEGVAKGYLNRADETADRFVTLTDYSDNYGRFYRTGDLGRYLPDGSIIFLGRQDNQVKIRGYRIEPDEVAAVLNRVPEVERAVVLALPAGETIQEISADENDISQLAWRLQAMGTTEYEKLLHEIESLPDTEVELTELAGQK
jgi:amino acid adenylation domain-containing protein